MEVGIMDEDVTLADKVQAELTQQQQLAVKANTIKDLQTVNQFLTLQVANFKAENHGLRRALDVYESWTGKVLEDGADGQKTQLPMKLQELAVIDEAIQAGLKSLREAPTAEAPVKPKPGGLDDQVTPST
jgi:hypothetical protein